MCPRQKRNCGRVLPRLLRVWVAGAFGGPVSYYMRESMDGRVEDKLCPSLATSDVSSS